VESTQSKVKYIIDDDDDKGRGKNDSDKQFAEIAKTFSDNIHPISGEIEKDKLTDLYEHYGHKWCMEAIKETALNHGRSIKYIERVLDDWERNGFKAPKPKAEKGGTKRGGNGSTRRKVKIEGLDDFDRFEEWQKQNRPWDVQPKPGSDGEEQGDHPESGGSASEMQGMQGELLAGGELQGDGPCPEHLRGQCV
jgi:DnaD/phage-associated family protein